MQPYIVDAHNHPDWYGMNADAFVREMDEYNIKKCWLLSWEAPCDEVDPVQYNVLSEAPYGYGRGPIGFSRCLAFREKYPDRFCLGYAPDPRSPECIDNLEAAISLYGVRIFGEVKVRAVYDDPDFIEVFRYCGRLRLPVVLHIENPSYTGAKYPRRSYWYGGGLEMLERLLEKCPDTVFIGHAQGFWAGMSKEGAKPGESYPAGPVVPGGKVPELLRRYSNLYCDLSANSGLNALSRDRGFAKEFLIEFQDRCLFARDRFGNKLQEFISGLDIPDGVKAKVFGGNAVSLLEGLSRNDDRT